MKGRKILSQERRKFQRIKIPLKIKYNYSAKEKSQASATCKDISGGGVRFVTSKPLSIKDRVTVSIYFDCNGPKIFNSLCKVVWINKVKDGVLEAGLKFIHTRPNPDFTNFLCDKILDVSLK